jgi:hypothetical protein
MALLRDVRVLAAAAAALAVGGVVAARAFAIGPYLDVRTFAIGYAPHDEIWGVRVETRGGAPVRSFEIVAPDDWHVAPTRVWGNLAPDQGFDWRVQVPNESPRPRRARVVQHEPEGDRAYEIVLGGDGK